MRPVFTRWKHKVPKKSKSSIFGTGKCNGKQVSVSTFTSWLPFACNSACYLVYCGLELFWMENTRSVDQMYCLHCGTLGLGLCIVFFLSARTPHKLSFLHQSRVCVWSQTSKALREGGAGFGVAWAGGGPCSKNPHIMSSLMLTRE